jgi:hypothetical protein
MTLPVAGEILSVPSLLMILITPPGEAGDQFESVNDGGVPITGVTPTQINPE